MDHKLMVTENQKRANKQNPNNKTKKKGPLKVVYITNPIKFKASASEFRALVQELTGQDSDVPESARSAADDDVVYGVGGEVSKAAAAAEDHNYVHAVEEGTRMRHTCEGGQNGSDPILGFGSYDDGFCAPQMMDSFQGLMTSSFWNDQGAHDQLDADDQFKANMDAM